jgi:2-dehydro-3-deoxyphosphooctonate aldolase (KDO 8-P synthase)
MINKSINIGRSNPLTIIAGPCVIENEQMIMNTAEELKKIGSKYPIQLVFKSSYKKANRTSIHGFTGIKFEDALLILDKIRKELSLPVLTDIHSEKEASIVADVVDILQIPAFLCRQTDLLIAAAKTGKIVNVKKGQFLAPEDMVNVAEKIRSVGNSHILLTERGTTFGYHNLIVDMRSLIIMAKTGYPVIFDATHSVQLPGGLGKESGGQSEFIVPLAKAAIATGALSGVFMEVHPDPGKALSDAASQLPLSRFESAINEFIKVYELSNI